MSDKIKVVRADLVDIALEKLPLCELLSDHDAHPTSSVTKCTGVGERG